MVYYYISTAQIFQIIVEAKKILSHIYDLCRISHDVGMVKKCLDGIIRSCLTQPKERFANKYNVKYNKDKCSFFELSYLVIEDHVDA